MSARGRVAFIAPKALSPITLPRGEPEIRARLRFNDAQRERERERERERQRDRERERGCMGGEGRRRDKERRIRGRSDDVN